MNTLMAALLVAAASHAQEMPWGKEAQWRELAFDGVQGLEVRVWALAEHLKEPERWVYGIEVPLYQLTTEGGAAVSRLSAYRAKRYWPREPRVVITLENTSFEADVTAGAPSARVVPEPSGPRTSAPPSPFGMIGSLPRPEPISKEYGAPRDGDARAAVLRRFTPLELALGAALEPKDGPRPAKDAPVLHAASYGDSQAVDAYAAGKRPALAEKAREMLALIRETPGRPYFTRDETVALVTLARSLELGGALSAQLAASGMQTAAFALTWRNFLAAELADYLGRAGALQGELDAARERAAAARALRETLDGDAARLAAAAEKARPPRRRPAPEPDPVQRRPEPRGIDGELDAR